MNSDIRFHVLGGANGQNVGHIRIPRVILKMAACLQVIIPDKKNTTVKFSRQVLLLMPNTNCHKILSVDRISPKLECGVDEHVCSPCEGTNTSMQNGKRVLEELIKLYCLLGIPSMLCKGKIII